MQFPYQALRQGKWTAAVALFVSCSAERARLACPESASFVQNWKNGKFLAASTAQMRSEAKHVDSHDCPSCNTVPTRLRSFRGFDEALSKLRELRHQDFFLFLWDRCPSEREVFGNWFAILVKEAGLHNTTKQAMIQDFYHTITGMSFHKLRYRCTPGRRNF